MKFPSDVQNTGLGMSKASALPTPWAVPIRGVMSHHHRASDLETLSMSPSQRAPTIVTAVFMTAMTIKDRTRRRMPPYSATASTIPSGSPPVARRHNRGN